MNGWLWGLLGLLGVGAVGYFVGLAQLARILRAVLGVLADWAVTARVWLQTPGNKMRLICAVLALLFLAAGLQSWQRGTIIVQQRADYVRLQEVTDWEKSRLLAEADALAGHVAERDVVIQRFIDLSEQQMRLLRLAEAQAAAALAEAAEAKLAAEDAERRFQDAFTDRPPECEAALQVMARACPTLKDY